MMKYILILIISTSVFSKIGYYQTSESSCSSIDLRESFPPIRDQKDISWCYSFTAADLLAYKYDLEPVSAAAVALDYNRKGVARIMKFFSDGYSRIRRRTAHKMPWQTGFIKLAMRNAMKKGICLDQDFPSDNYIQVDSLGNKKTVDMSTFLADTYKNKHSDNYTYEFPKISASDYNEIKNHSSKRHFLQNIKNRSCENRVTINSRKVKMKFVSKRMYRKLNAQISKKNPVWIDYNSKVYFDKNKRKQVQTKRLKSLHTSLVVGREFNKDTKTCDYLIRNSYGSDCAARDYSERIKCEDGYFWLSEDRLWPYLLSMGWIK